MYQLQAQPYVEETMAWHMAGEAKRDELLNNLSDKYLTNTHFQRRVPGSSGAM